MQSLAKWKRYALKQYGFSIGEGLYTDMNAIRRDEDDRQHPFHLTWISGTGKRSSIKRTANLDTLKETVRNVYKALRKTEKYMAIQYDYIEEILPHEIFFITTQELEDMYPGQHAQGA